MKQFEYTVTEPVGIHARPAGLLTKEAKKYKSTIMLTKGGKSVNVLKLMALMGLGVKCGDTVSVTVIRYNESGYYRSANSYGFGFGYGFGNNSGSSQFYAGNGYEELTLSVTLEILDN